MSGYKQLLNSLADSSSILHELSSEESKHLKELLLKAASDILAVCERNGLCVMFGGGSTLGAVRHKGFIPWDDDLDLLMPRNDYEKFRATFPEELGEKYILNAPNTDKPAYARFPKVEIKGTEFTQLQKTPHRIAIDIFILENVPASELKRRIYGIKAQALMGIAGQVDFALDGAPELKSYMSATGVSRLAYDLKTAVGRIFGFLPSCKWFDIADKANQYKKDEGYWGIPSGRKHYFGEIFPKEVYVPVSYGEFEGIKVPLPGDTDRYLRNLYGDYMTLPPEDKRERHFVCRLRFDVDESEYTAEEGGRQL